MADERRRNNRLYPLKRPTGRRGAHDGSSASIRMVRCDAVARVQIYQGKASREINQILARILSPLVRFCLESPFQSLPEVFSGNPPHLPGGTTSQAWSVAEVLRILVEYAIVEE